MGYLVAQDRRQIMKDCRRFRTAPFIHRATAMISHPPVLVFHHQRRSAQRNNGAGHDGNGPDDQPSIGSQSCAKVCGTKPEFPW